jgi:DNA excision repair protein ERCC-4
VERKGIADLFQSFGSGRLFNQAEQMLKHYKFAALLIEFHQDKSFSLQNRGELSSEIQLTSICSKMTLLMLSFPKLKILWSRSPNATADIFKSLKVNHKDPDVEKAVDCGANTGYDGDNRDSAGNTTKEARARDDATNILMSLPGINNVNYRQVINHVDDLAALSRMSVSELVPIIGPANAKKLVTFFSQKPIR